MILRFFIDHRSVTIELYFQIIYASYRAQQNNTNHERVCSFKIDVDNCESPTNCCQIDKPANHSSFQKDQFFKADNYRYKVLFLHSIVVNKESTHGYCTFTQSIVPIVSAFNTKLLYGTVLPICARLHIQYKRIHRKNPINCEY